MIRRRPPSPPRTIALQLILLAAPVVASPAADEPAGPRLDVWEYQIDGNTVLDDAAIEAAVAPFMGPGRTPEQIDAARAALEAAYREHGYRTVAVSIPQQSAADGTVRLEVAESRVGRLAVTGSRYHSLERIRELAPALAEGGVPDFDAVRDDLVALNREPDRRVTPALKAGRRPGTVDVDHVVDDKLPLHGALELNNRYSQDTSELRAIASLSYGNLWQRGHDLSLTFQTAPQDTADARVFYGSYVMPFDGSRWSLILSGLRSDSDVSTVGGINVVGNGNSIGLRAMREMDAGDGRFAWFTVGIERKDFLTRTRLGSSDFDTPVTYYPLSLGYSLAIQGERGDTQFDLGLGFAPADVGSDTTTIQLNRFRARGQMLHLRGSVAHTHEFDGGAELFSRLAFQLTDQPLISNEQFSAGGMDSARGYLEAEALGDRGFAATLELRSPRIESFPGLPDSLADGTGMRLFAFLDAADLRLEGPLPDDSYPTGEQLLSAGAGVDLTLSKRVNAVLDWSHVLADGPTTDAGADRVLFRLWTSF